LRKKVEVKVEVEVEVKVKVKVEVEVEVEVEEIGETRLKGLRRLENGHCHSVLIAIGQCC